MPIDAQTTAPPPLVHTDGDRRRLEFCPGMIQSEMLLSRPDHLLLRYARAMMCFTLFVPRPRHILMVGLGGGSLLKFCHRYLPETRITVLELRADVIALREQFMVPPDDARLRIIETDAVSYIRQHPASADVLLLDGFDASGLPPALGSARFYADCLRALVPGGVLVANLFNYDPHYAAMLGAADADLSRPGLPLRRHRRQQPHHLRRQAGTHAARPRRAHGAPGTLARPVRPGLPEPAAAALAAVAPARRQRPPD